MSVELQTSSYIVASILFILSLGGLSNEEKAKRAVWFGIFDVIVVEFGLVSLPVGMNLFVIKGVMQNTPLQTIWFGTIPFLLTDVIRVALIIAFPAICLYLPSLMTP